MSQTPSHIARYTVVQPIAAGGMGEVFLARDERLDRLVAIKLLREGFDNEDLRQRFEEEARNVAKLTHPNIVTIYEYGAHDGRPYIAMEYVAGRSMADLIRRQLPLPLARRVRLVEELCSGLAHAHKAHLVHRDVKPANLMVATSGMLKVLDFGIAKLRGTDRTQKGMLVGTVNYMSPEQITGQPVDHRSDIFAVGAVLHELLTYEQAFKGDLTTAMFNIVHGRAEPLATRCPGLDPGFQAVVDRCLAKDPAARYQDLSPLKRDLARLRRPLEDEDAEPADTMPPLDSEDTVIVSAPTASAGVGPDTRRALDSALTAGEAALASGLFESALRHAEKALALDADNATALDLLARTKRAIAEAHLRSQIGKARDALGADQIDAARTALVEAAKVAPASETVRNLAARVEQRAADLDRFSDVVEQARQRLDDRDFEKARQLAETAVIIRPDDSGLQRLRNQIEHAEADQKKWLDGERKAIDAHVAAQEFDQALARLERALIRAPRVRELAARVVEVRTSQRQAEARRREEEARKAAEAEKRRREEEARQAAEAEKRRREEEARKAAEAEKRRLEEEARKAAEAEKRRREEEARKAAEAEQRRLEEEARKAAEAEKRRREEEARKAAEAEQRRLEEEARKAAEAEKRRREEEARKAAEAERHRREKEARKAAEAERRRLEEEARQAAAAEQRRREEDARQAAEARRRQEEERRAVEARRAEEARQAAEARRRDDERRAAEQRQAEARAAQVAALLATAERATIPDADRRRAAAEVLQLEPGHAEAGRLLAELDAAIAEETRRRLSEETQLVTRPPTAVHLGDTAIIRPPASHGETVRVHHPAAPGVSSVRAPDTQIVMAGGAVGHAGVREELRPGRRVPTKPLVVGGLVATLVVAVAIWLRPAPASIDSAEPSAGAPSAPERQPAGGSPGGQNSGAPAPAPAPSPLEGRGPGPPVAPPGGASSNPPTTGAEPVTPPIIPAPPPPKPAPTEVRPTPPPVVVPAPKGDTSVTNPPTKTPDPRPEPPAPLPPAPRPAPAPTEPAVPPVEKPVVRAASPEKPSADEVAARRRADEAQIHALVNSFGAAYQRKDVNGMRAVWQGMQSADVSSYGNFFRSYEQVSWTTGATAIQFDGDRATAQSTITVALQPLRGRATTQTRTYRFRVERRGQQWVMTGAENLGATR